MSEFADTEKRLEQLGLKLPDAPKPVANYEPFMILDGGAGQTYLHISGQVSTSADGGIKGKLGDNLSVEQGQDAARLSCLNVLAQARAAAGTLDRILKTVRITGYVNATPDFTEHPLVINGASDMLAELLQERGRHTRAAVGVASLPLGFAVEIDAIFQLGG